MLSKYRELVNVKCELCGSTDNHLTLPFKERFGTTLKAIICKTCGLVFLNPRWSDKSYTEFYKEDYRKLMGESDTDPTLFFERQVVHGSDILSFCSDFIAEGSHVLDVGCATGGVLEVFRKYKESKVFGIEPFMEHVQYCKKHLNIGVFNGLIEDYKGDNNGFDFIIFTQTLNHVLYPLCMLNLINKMLKPEGKVFLEVQNFPEYAKTCQCPVQVDHTYYFAPATLEALAKKAGFHTIKLKVDTAKSAQQVDQYVWHKGAFIHIHLLLEKKEGKIDPQYPDSKTAYDELIRIHKMQTASAFSRIARRLIWGEEC